MLKGLNPPITAALLAALAAALILGAFPAMAQENPGKVRERDTNIGNSGQMRTGQDERGNEVMEIKPKPKTQQEMPNMGPIYVIPQVNRGGSPAPVILPQAPAQSQPQAQPPVQQQMQPGQQFQPQVQPQVQPGQ